MHPHSLAVVDATTYRVTGTLNYKRTANNNPKTNLMFDNICR